ncbi:MAG: PPC domain-containing protein [Isosphaeraceae bacterium]
MKPWTTVVAALLSAACPAPCTALQLPQPRLDSLFPVGGRAGETVDVRITGADLEGADTLDFDHPGLRSFRFKEPNRFRIAIAPDVPPGPYELRASSPLGLSNSRIFVVGDRPEIVEAEPNDRAEQATPIRIDAVIEGVIQAPPDVDCYRLAGKQGQRLVLDLQARRIDSPLDATLRLFHPDGRLLAEARESAGLSPSIEVNLPADGEYLVKVYDTTYSGGPAYAYRLIAHGGPRILSFYPPLGPSPASIHGTGLGPLSTPSPFRLEGLPLEQLSWTEAAGEPSWIGRRNRLDSRVAGLFGWEWLPRGADAFPQPFLIAATNDPIVMEVEPNGLGSPQHINLPVDIAGCLQEPGDRDAFQFQAKAGQAWWFEVWADRLGRPVDASIVIQKVGDDGKVQDLANADDTPDPDGPAARFPAHTVDPRIRWVSPGDGAYQVVVSDLYGSQRGDARMAYRLQVRPDRPDFQLFVVPDSASALTVRAGGRATAHAVIRRRDGFARPVRLEAVHLPSGLAFDPAVIGPSQIAVPLVFSADAHAAGSRGSIRLVGRSLSSGRKDILADGQKPVEELEREVLSGQVNPPNPAIQPPPPFKGRLTGEFAVAIRDSAPFRLDATPSEVWVSAGESVQVSVRVQRFEGFTEAVSLAAADLPAKVTVTPANIAREADSTPLTIQVAADATAGISSLVIRGSGAFPFHKDPDNKAKPNVSVNEPSNRILLNIRR